MALINLNIDYLLNELDKSFYTMPEDLTRKKNLLNTQELQFLKLSCSEVNL